jgi:hypothetical protein
MPYGQTSHAGFMTRQRLADELTRLGLPTSAATLASLATRGGGPKYFKYGRRVVYRWPEVMVWLESRLGAAIHHTSEVD